MIRLLIALTALPLVAAAERTTISLDGVWQIDESVAATPPAQYRHTVQVPGLANLAAPAFPDVDRFDSRELIGNKIRRKLLPETARTDAVGVSRQERNYFWHRRTFFPPSRKSVAILRVNKAQFGTAVWLNGQSVGEHHGAFTAGVFDLSRAIRWDGDNELVIRVGAHPGMMPQGVPAGTDFEKLKWTPGIYDSVSLELSDNPVITSVQVAPRIASSEALVQTEVKNFGAAPATFSVRHSVRLWKGGPAGAAESQRITLAPGETRALTQTLRLRDVRLWTPETPNLYVVETSTGGDALSTRFGMREFRFDTATRRAYLNGKPYFLRGSNITLHRFFEDPDARALPWDEKWVRKLLIDIPKRLHWNSFRFCIGPVPQKWLDIADEAGLLIQYEYFIWTARNEWHKEWGEKELIREYTEWLRDNWNHPSVAIWDSSNETIADVLGDRVIPAVRGLDLSNRPWDNGYNLPSGPDDVIEDHPYLFGGIASKPPRFRLTDLERMNVTPGLNAPFPTAHAAIANEYGWLWLNRDGTPTLLTKDVWDAILGPQATNAQRLEEWSYLLAGLTEFWRSKRYYAGVLHFVYLTCSFPGVFTSDHWRDVTKLELDPDFEKHVGEAFKPLGVYLNFWQPQIKAGGRQRVAVSVVNDGQEPARGKLTLTAGATVLGEKPLDVPGLGQHTWLFEFETPRQPGPVVIKAVATTSSGASTTSWRKTSIAP
jgi:hypothetical protein